MGLEVKSRASASSVRSSYVDSIFARPRFDRVRVRETCACTCASVLAQAAMASLRRVRLLLCHLRRRHTLHPPFTAHKPTPSSSHSLNAHSPTQHHTSTQSPIGDSPVLCWKCHRDLGEVSHDEGRERGSEETGEWEVNFFCPCDEHVILPPSKRHTHFEIMNW